MFIARKGLRALPGFESDRNNFIFEATCFNRRCSTHLRAQRKLILLFACDLIPLRKNFSSLSHYELRQRAEKPVTIHSVH